MAASQNKTKTIILINTTLGPPRISYSKEINTPIKKQKIEMMAEQIVTLLNLLNKRMALRAGKIIRLVINIDPIVLMPSTMVNAVNSAISEL